MTKRFSPEFKQQAIDHAFSNAHEPLSTISNKLGDVYLNGKGEYTASRAHY